MEVNSTSMEVYLIFHVVTFPQFPYVKTFIDFSGRKFTSANIGSTSMEVVYKLPHNLPLWDLPPALSTLSPLGTLTAQGVLTIGHPAHTHKL